MMRSLFFPKNAAAAGSSLGEKEELDAYDEGVRARLDDEPGDFSVSKSGWPIGSLCCVSVIGSCEVGGKRDCSPKKKIDSPENNQESYTDFGF